MIDTDARYMKEEMERFFGEYRALRQNKIASVEFQKNDGLIVFYIGLDNLQHWIALNADGYEAGINKDVSYSY